MQLGDWVEFESIVRKEATAAGIHPVRQPLNQPRRGIIVGSRQVYEVQPGSPPTLRNPRTVLLIAVSVGRCYRVFPQDARPSSQPRQRRGLSLPGMTPAPAAVLAPATTTQGAATGMTVPLQMTHAGTRRRVPVTHAALELLVADVINARLAAGDMFTAHEVTQALRAAHPGFDIRHDDVRQVVHVQMESLVAGGLYDRECADFGQATAIRYLPA